MITPSAGIALLGFGETGALLGRQLARRGCSVRAWDMQLDHASSAQRMRHRIELAGVDVATTFADALRGARLVISAVGAASAADVVRHGATLLTGGQVYVDLDAVPPAIKAASASLVESAGAHYIDAVLMSPASGAGAAVQLLLGGRRARELAPALDSLGIAARFASNEVGLARPASSEDGAQCIHEHAGQPMLRPVPRAELP